MLLCKRLRRWFWSSEFKKDELTLEELEKDCQDNKGVEGLSGRSLD